jgi:hypothetical protein
VIEVGLVRRDEVFGGAEQGHGSADTVHQGDEVCKAKVAALV